MHFSPSHNHHRRRRQYILTLLSLPPSPDSPLSPLLRLRQAARRRRRAASLPSPSRPLSGRDPPSADLRVPLPHHDAHAPPHRPPLRRRLPRRRIRHLGSGLRRGGGEARAPRRRPLLPGLQRAGEVPRQRRRPQQTLPRGTRHVAGGPPAGERRRRRRGGAGPRGGGVHEGRHTPLEPVGRER